MSEKEVKNVFEKGNTAILIIILNLLIYYTFLFIL